MKWAQCHARRESVERQILIWMLLDVLRRFTYTLLAECAHGIFRIAALARAESRSARLFRGKKEFHVVAVRPFRGTRRAAKDSSRSNREDEFAVRGTITIGDRLPR